MNAEIEKLLGEFLLTDTDVARMLRVTTDTIKNLHRTGQLKAVKVGKHNRWLPSVVQAYVDALGGDSKAA